MQKTLRIISAALLVFNLGIASAHTYNKTTTSVRVFGDSLADSGTFGYKFTVNNAGIGGAATPIFPELVANQFGLPSSCNFYSINPLTYTTTTNLQCKNFAVGGARINNLNSTLAGGNANPASIAYQMDTSRVSTGGRFPANELILVDGGGNDAADLITAYINATTPAGIANYTALLSTILPAAMVQSMINLSATTSNPLNGAQQLAGLYMVALANKMANDVNTKLIANGAKRIAIVNIPAITSTPRFKSVLRNIAASPVGITGATAIESLGRAWIQAFNKTLKFRFTHHHKVVVVDLFTELDNQLRNPQQYGLNNPISLITGVTDTACPITGLDSLGLPSYNFTTCTAAALNTTATINNTWRTKSFSDGFHPTPYVHRLLANLVTRSLRTKGWTAGI
jgi:phospholipase/lecithinase/hemolysin